MQLLGGLSPEQFLAEYWQKKPLLIRNAWDHFPELIDYARLAELSQHQDVESRLIEYKAGQWKAESGPFRPSRLARLPETDWTILVGNVNHLVPHIADLLYQFNFLPFTRLDDLMISYAPPGGTVGPHYDSYDVFLLQVGGKKRWQISSDDASGFIEDAPIRVLKEFHPEQEWVLEHGDMLYLPPMYAHYGVAMEPGMTYSIGFRAPKTQEIAGKFLEFLQDELCLDGMYADPQRKPTTNPAEIDDEFVRQMGDMLKKITWNDETIRRFVGSYFTEPKPHVFYNQPDDPLELEEFTAALAAGGIKIDPKALFLYETDRVYANSEALEFEPDALPWLQQLADQRGLPAADYPDSLINILYECYEYGYLQLS